MKLLIALALAAAPSALAMAPYVPDDEGPTAAPTLYTIAWNMHFK